MQPHDEQGEDQLTIPGAEQSSEPSRALDSLGPSRSLPARPEPGGSGSSPFGLLGGALSMLAAIALFALPPSREAPDARSLLANTLARIRHDGLPLRDVQCPRELKLGAGEPFHCGAQVDGVQLRIELTPTASQERGTLDTLSVHIDGAVGVAEVSRAAAQRYAAGAQVTCPRRYWLAKPGAREQCTLQVGKDEGPLAVLGRNQDGELALEAPWLHEPRAAAQ